MSTSTESRPTYSAAKLHRPRRRRRRRLMLLTVVPLILLVVAAVLAVAVVRFLHDDSRRHYLAGDGWPARGQAAYAVDDGPGQASPGQQPAPIASVAKVMTAVLVLRSAPLAAGSDGFRMTVTAGDVADTAMRRSREESVVAVRAGEVLSERQALAALLLPSANNVAIMLARKLDGTVARFVARMNRLAASLGMAHTRYTDPSGFTESTVSTAADQLRLAQEAMRNPTFAQLVRLRSYPLPVAGTVHNTDTLLGSRGVVGIKTGSDDAAGGCFMFRVVRVQHGRQQVLTGVVLGQHGHNLIRAGLYAGVQLADRVLG